MEKIHRDKHLPAIIYSNGKNGMKKESIPLGSIIGKIPSSGIHEIFPIIEPKGIIAKV